MDILSEIISPTTGKKRVQLPGMEGCQPPPPKKSRPQDESGNIGRSVCPFLVSSFPDVLIERTTPAQQ
jgi:hypothetical protein